MCLISMLLAVHLDQLVDSFNVKEIKVLSGPAASEYGSRGANGVIIITTYN